MIKSISTLLLCVFSYESTTAQAFDGLDGNRYLKEENPLNLDDKADAYSWLSKDGLRIYFSRDNSEGEVWKAERKNLNEKFMNPYSVSIDGLGDDSDIFSSWLTEDEKTIYFVTQKNNGDYTTSVYKAVYNEETNSFINPVKLNLSSEVTDGTSNIFLSGPSFTDDLTQLYVYYSDHSGADRIACYTSRDSLNYQFKSFLTDAINFCPGVIADHGLSYYLTLRNENSKLVKLTRKDLNSEFYYSDRFTIRSARVYVSTDKFLSSEKSEDIKNEEISYYQPSVNTALGILSVTSGSGTWDSNDLEIIELPENNELYSQTIVSDSVQTYLYTDSFAANTLNNIGYFHLTEMIDSCDSSKKYWIAEQYWIDTAGKNDSILIVNDETNKTPVSIDLKNISFEAFPNPAEDYIEVKFKLNLYTSEKLFFELMDLTGKVIKRIELNNQSGIQTVEISEVAEGIYLYSIRTGTVACLSKKLIIRR